MKIIGVGFGRTGTASLKVALEELGLGPSYHMSEVFATPGHIDLWIRAADQVAAGETPDWDTIFSGYPSGCDFPIAGFWRELADHYPDAKIILTVRDPEKWFASTQETILSPRMVDMSRPTPFGELSEKAIWRYLGGDVHDRSKMLDAFDRHVKAVKNTIAPTRLLVFEVKDGWAPLCEFLGVSEPDKEFPRVNSQEETKAVLEMLMAEGAEQTLSGGGLGDTEDATMNKKIFGKD
ncbi:sulfotransferase family protein [Hyphococcus lacteus]|uniref:Sulfotransferase family protein n=1 Tax=Hyphococcus lacteus TaxID=3143536 RepID=A0ABV3Z388_9PROT